MSNNNKKILIKILIKIITLIPFKENTLSGILSKIVQLEVDSEIFTIFSFFVQQLSNIQIIGQPIQSPNIALVFNLIIIIIRIYKII
jgi:hypothetical protein